MKKYCEETAESALQKECRKKRLFDGMAAAFALMFLMALAGVVFLDIEPVKTVVPPFLAFWACRLSNRTGQL